MVVVVVAEVRLGLRVAADLSNSPSADLCKVSPISLSAGHIALLAGASIFRQV